ncbi:hypothetical protein ABGB17_24620 [Sphaerisporangium sp. B11E5]|uniref:hypothetical protein n=1 Tax=Sphaerisporangium sp. B11E5 TaxID=3153563 RepID=UPI00325D451D
MTAIWSSSEHRTVTVHRALRAAGRQAWRLFRFDAHDEARAGRDDAPVMAG